MPPIFTKISKAGIVKIIIKHPDEPDPDEPDPDDEPGSASELRLCSCFPWSERVHVFPH
jgi:protein tyrosine phosphatase (PTP) superfamily phosphohydrolase (DUF442 family)